MQNTQTVDTKNVLHLTNRCRSIVKTCIVLFIYAVRVIELLKGFRQTVFGLINICSVCNVCGSFVHTSLSQFCTIAQRILTEEILR